MSPVILEQKPSVLAPKVPDEQALGARHICLDAETCHAGKKDIETAKDLWKPPANIKDFLKIEQRRKEAYGKIETKSALLDWAPIGILGTRTEKEAVIFTGVPAKKRFTGTKKFPTLIYDNNNERDMLIAFREYVDKRTLVGTVVIGFNIFTFDLPKLRFAYLRHRLVLPMIVQPEARDAGIEVYDVMKKFTRYFSTEYADDYRAYVTLEEVLTRLGFTEFINGIEGADVPDLLAAGQVDKPATKCVYDVLGTYSAFLAMTGNYADQEKGKH